jgi:uncharacterized cupredoxin-like copper-binding protein
VAALATLTLTAAKPKGYIPSPVKTRSLHIQKRRDAMRQMRTGITLLTLAAVALVAVACAGKAAAIPTVSIGAADYSFALPDSIPGGLTQIQFTNTGKEAHHAQFARLNDGVTVQQFQAALPQGPSAVIPLVTFTGGPAPVGPGGQSEAVVELTAGQYLLLCFVPSPDGVPHVAKGMVKPLAVTAAPAKQPGKPAVKGTVDLQDFAFGALPGNVSAGKTALAVVNKGKEIHEMVLLKPKGIPAAQLLQVLSAPPGSAPPPGPPPFEWAGGYQAIMPGATGWATLDLSPGEYALVCFVPSPANQGKPHLALGMFLPFTVR